ncbi:Rha family transcriptional regulator [Glutamicibacter arilaitensis]|uniref:Rha family transcriptional regulator n=1 Tax=Glutamicibacter arilaitensis TaxID=256701 RepID=UPI003FD03388
MTATIVPMIETSNNELVVSSEQIATGAGVQHKNTLELIKANQAELEEFGAVAFETRPLPGGGNPVRVALLNEPQAMLLMTFQRNTPQVKTFKVALIKEFRRLATQPVALTEDQIVAQALQITMGKVQQLEAKIEQDSGKVLYVDTHVKPENVQPFNTVAKNLGVNASDLRKALIYRRWIYIDGCRISKEGVRANRYSAYQNHNYPTYFKHCVTHEVARLNGTPWHTLKITPEGVAAVTRFVEKLANEYGSLREALPELEAKYNQRKGIAA